MNLNALPSAAMAAISAEWLGNEDITAAVTAHPLGAMLWVEVRRAHDTIVQQNSRRMAMQKRLRDLIGRITELGVIHNRKARCLRNLILDVAESTDDAELAEFLRGVDALLFPNRLRIVHMSYFEQAGAVLTIEQCMTPEILQRLETCRVVDQSLADVYRAWIAAGKELGELSQERARIEAALRRTGSAASRTHARVARSAWVRRVNLFLDALEILELGEHTEEAFLSPLEVGIAQALARRARAGTDIEPDAGPAIRQVVAPDISQDTSQDISQDISQDTRIDIEPDIEPGTGRAAPDAELVVATGAVRAWQESNAGPAQPMARRTELPAQRGDPHAARQQDAHA